MSSRRKRRPSGRSVIGHIKHGAALVLFVAGCSSGEDPDLAGAPSVDTGTGGRLIHVVGNWRTGDGLRQPRYLPAWGPYFPDSLVTTKIYQTFGDGQAGRITEMVTSSATVEEVAAFYRAAIVGAGFEPDTGSGFPLPGQTVFTVSPGNKWRTDSVIVSDTTWEGGPNQLNPQVTISVREAIPEN